MRKRTVRKGLRFVLAALLLIVLGSFYHAEIAGFFVLSANSEERLFKLAILLAAAAGGYGVVLTVFGFVLQRDIRDGDVRLLPVFLLIAITFLLFFFLLISSFKEKTNPGYLRPGETITI